MSKQMRHEDWDHEDEYDDDHHDDDHDDDGDEFEFEFEFEFPGIFKIDFSDFNLKKIGKITDYEVSDDHLSVTFGKQWTFSVDGSDFDFVTNKAKMPVVTSGTIDSFSIDGPGKADFSISGLDLSAKALYSAIVNLQGAKLLGLLLGGDETISGSGFGDFLYGAAGNDTLLGNEGRDKLLGGAGDDIIEGGAGGDYLMGGCGADTFRFAPGSGMDLIADFDASADTIDLTAFGFTGTLGDLIRDQPGWGGQGRCHGGDDDDVILDLGHGDMIKLKDVSSWELTESNVLL